MTNLLNKIIMLSIKYKLLRPFQKLFSVLGLRLHLTLIDKNKNIQFFDKNIWIPFVDKKNYYVSLYNENLKKTGKEWSNNFSKELRFYSLFALADKYSKINKYDHFAECGCWHGHSSLSISKILLKNNFSATFEIYDSFEGGLSEFSNFDNNIHKKLDKNEIIKQRNAFSSSEKFVKNILNEYNFVKIYKGWIPAVFKNINEKKYQFVHIDVDLYEPTNDALNYFYPKLINNGLIIVDDYNLSQFPGAKKAVDDFILNNKISFFYEVPFGGCFIIK